MSPGKVGKVEEGEVGKKLQLNQNTSCPCHGVEAGVKTPRTCMSHSHSTSVPRDLYSLVSAISQATNGWPSDSVRPAGLLKSCWDAGVPPSQEWPCPLRSHGK